MSIQTKIIPVASGKGGVGKSIFAASLSIALARRGYSTVAVDLDLGGSNLYTCLGLPNTRPGIGDYLKAGNLKFKDLLTDTGIPNLQFIAGDGRTPFMANISYDQRLLLIRELKKISAHYLILDLGAGSIFNTLSFFGLSYKSMIITNFETPSVMNFIMFLRNFMFRLISSVVRHNRKVLNMLIEAFQQPMTSAPITVNAIIGKIAAVDLTLAEEVKKTCEKYTPRIIFNMGDHPDDLKILKKLDASLKQGLSVQTEYFGFIFYDDTVRLSAKKREVLMSCYPQSVAAQNIERIASRVINNWDRTIENSADRLVAEVKELYHRRK